MISLKLIMRIQSFKQDEELENLVTVSQVKHHMWLDGKPLNYDVKKSPNSQDFPDINAITYGICIISKQDMIKYRNVNDLKILLLKFWMRLNQLISIRV